MVVLLLSDVTTLSDAAAAVVSAREGMIIYNSTMKALQQLNLVCKVHIIKLSYAFPNCNLQSFKYMYPLRSKC